MHLRNWREFFLEEVTPAQGAVTLLLERGWEQNVWSPSDALELLVTGEVLGSRCAEEDTGGVEGQEGSRAYGRLAQGHTRRVTQRHRESTLGRGTYASPTRPPSLAESGDISACP